MARREVALGALFPGNRFDQAQQSTHRRLLRTAHNTKVSLSVHAYGLGLRSPMRIPDALSPHFASMSFDNYNKVNRHQTDQCLGKASKYCRGRKIARVEVEKFPSYLERCYARKCIPIKMQGQFP